MMKQDRASWSLFMLTLICCVYFMDRAALNTVGEAVKKDLGLSDFELGIAGGLAFSVVNALASIPLARFAERFNRVRIIAAAAILWSLFTALCGFAQSFIHLLAARFLVGVAEAGAPAPSQSLIADLFPPERRARALAIYGSGVPLGIILGAATSGWIIENLNWRIAFFAFGIPGILLGLVLVMTVREPERNRWDAIPPGASLSLVSVIQELLRQRAYRHLLIGGVALYFVLGGLLQFMHPYILRRFEVGYSDAALIFGVVIGVSTFIGMWSGGFLASFLQPDRQLLIPALAGAVAAVTLVLGLSESHMYGSLAWLFLCHACANAYFGPLFAQVGAFAPGGARATSVAFSALVMNIIGFAFGPLFVGFLSEYFSAGCSGGTVLKDFGCGSEAYGLRLALIFLSPFLLWSSFHFWRSATSGKLK